MIETFENKGDLNYYLIPRLGLIDSGFIRPKRAVNMHKTEIISKIEPKIISEPNSKPKMEIGLSDLYDKNTITPVKIIESSATKSYAIKNFEPRIYQQTILAKCAEKNILVVLPTGLGKTSIAIMLAIQRIKSFPKSKILFLAPTRPLVEQHKSSFEKYTNLPSEKMSVFTGFVKPEKRELLWKQSQIVFSTPQGIENDIINERIKLEEVSLIIFDEAHRSTGDYAYNFVAKQYVKKADFPKILGLTASPGSEIEKIVEVCQNLFIENVELRTEKDADVMPYIKETKVNWIKVDLPPEFLEIQKILKICYISKLREISSLGFLNKARINNLGKTELLGLQAGLHGEIAQGNKDMDILKSISLSAEAFKIQHGLELLETQGISQLNSYLEKLEHESAKTTVKAVKNLVRDPNFKSAYVKTRILLEKNLEHPKLGVLKELIGKEFQRNVGAKVIVFTQYRDTASKIKAELDDLSKILQGDNITRADSRVFVGQAKKNGTGLSQKKQKELLQEFSEGKFNVLIATSVAEEGIDIPRVDTVIFYEPIPSAIRHIQRKGRTGRLEEGKVTILMARNTRDEGYRWSAFHKEKRMHKHIEEIKEQFAKLNFAKKEIDNSICPEKDVFVMVDDREKGSNIVKELINIGVKVRLKRMETGDFMLSPRCVVEFKNVSDFVNSIIDGRLLPQIRRLKENYEKPLLIIEGEEDVYSQRNIHPNAIRGMISTITVNFGVPILYTKNFRDTASLLGITAKREQLDGMKDFSSHSRKPLSTKEMQEYIISSLPGVGTKLSKPLLEKFGSIKNIVNANQEELKEIEKIGCKKAAEIQRLLCEEYKKE